jgi:transposase
MHIRKVFQHLLRLQGVRVAGVEFRVDAYIIFIDVVATGRGRACSRCQRRSRAGSYDSKKRRLWRHLDLGCWEIYLRSTIHRFWCKGCRAIVTEQIPWAEFRSAFTRDFEDLVAYFVQQTNKTVVGHVMKVAWPTVGNILERTVHRRGIPLERRKLYRIGIDEISYRKHHKDLTIVADHVGGGVVWGGEGKSGETLDVFLDELGEEGRARIELVSMDMSQAYIQKVSKRLPSATIVFDAFHVIKLANEAVDEVRRAQVRALKGDPRAVSLKKTRWLLLTAYQNLLPSESVKLCQLAVANRPLYRAYLLKEALRDLYREPIFVAELRLDAWLAWASRSKLSPFVKLARTIRAHRKGILAAIEHGLSNGRLEGLNNRIRLLSHQAFGFHSAGPLLAMVYLCCAGIKIPLPSDQRPQVDPYRI